MNQRGKAHESLRLHRGAYVLLLMVCILVSGCAIASETDRVFFLARRTTHIEPKFYPYIRSDRLAQREARRLAEQAWAEYVGTTGKTEFSADFENGFVEGFADYLYRGGSGEPPVIPPRGYWNLRFLNQFGKVTIGDWYEGFRQGAQDCKSRGLREMWLVPTSLISDKPNEPPEGQSLNTPPERTLNQPVDSHSAAEALAIPAPEPESESEPEKETEKETAESPDTSDGDSGAIEQHLRPGTLDLDPVLPVIEGDDDEFPIVVPLSMQNVRPATGTPTGSTIAGSGKRPPATVAQMSNQVDLAQSGAQARPLASEFPNALRLSKARSVSNGLRVPSQTVAAERLRLVFEASSNTAAEVGDDLPEFPVIPLEVSPRVEQEKPLPRLSPPNNWQADARSQELPLRVQGPTDGQALKVAAAEVIAPEPDFDELELLLSSAEDSEQLPRIIQKADRAKLPANDAEGTNVIRWRIRD